MAGEVVGSGGRIKYAEHRAGLLRLPDYTPEPLRQLAQLMARLEACGMVPILDDGLVGGNCAIAAAASGVDGLAANGSDGGGYRESSSSGSSSGGVAAAGPGEAGSGGGGGGAILISRSGKRPGVALAACDWVLLTRFSAARWEAEFESAADGARPSSDAPLHAAALGAGAAERYGWEAQPLVALHGHALAEGAGLERARQKGLPISNRETLFSTPEDLDALEALFRHCPYPRHRCYIRRGHGFLLLSQSVGEAEAYLEQHILPLALAAAGPSG